MYRVKLYPVAAEETALHASESESVGSEGKILTVFDKKENEEPTCYNI